MAANYDKNEPVNLGRGEEISIKELADLIKKRTAYAGEIVWDTTKPNGQPRRMLDVSRAEREFGFPGEFWISSHACASMLFSLRIEYNQLSRVGFSMTRKLSGRCHAAQGLRVKPDAQCSTGRHSIFNYDDEVTGGDQ